MRAAALFVFNLAASGLRLHDAPSSPEKDTLVIVRTHLPASGMQQRIQKLARDVEEKLPSAHMLVSVDDSHLEEGQRWNVPLSPEHVHRFVWDEVRAEFPLVQWGNLTGQGGFADGRTFHMEPILLAVEWAKSKVPVRADAFVWVLEDDVLVCGSFSKIVESYASNKADLLTRTLQSAEHWPHREFASEAFLKKYPVEKRYQSAEFVERFSMKFLRHIQHLSRARAISAQSEMFAPTVCQHDGFTQAYYNEQHTGVWNWAARIPSWAENMLCWGKNDMNHAAKYAAEGMFWEPRGRQQEQTA